MLMRLFFIRHGESQANVLQVISNRGHKHGLTEKGRVQVANLAQKLASTPFVRLYSSPLLRAVQTAELLSRDLGIPIEVTDALREFDCGNIEGKSDPDSWEIHLQLREAWFLRKEWDERIEGGESFLDIQHRFLPFIEGLIQEFGSTQDNLLLIGHGGLFQCMLPLVFTNVAFEHVLDLPGGNTGIILAKLTATGLCCQEWDGQVIS
jgi:2,3-bisphosphoglycerate-dependent phosphoglycerate mutase